MKSLYQLGPKNISDELTKPTKSFKKHVWLSVLGLLFFISLYLLLTFWFGKLAYNLFSGNGHFLVKLLAVGFGFLSLFMAKSLFVFSKKEKNPIDKFITKDDEPILFDYLNKLADEAGAPRPHKVFLSDRVNASVSYDLSLLNLLIPSKKNLEIGLGLVNVLNLGEFKAVIAHEFGHFAQRSMLLGRYVYIAQQIARKIVTKRDVFDKILSGISSFDLRIAWVGWILSILVWSIRSLIETCFNVVAIAERALSREMEFQADLVAVSLTGSDALIHALSKLQVADEAYNGALEIMNSELTNKKGIYNLYSLQSNYIKKMSWILNKPSYGKSPIIPKTNPSANRIFTSRTYNPPQMWSTHPADKDREENAKKTYIQAEIATNSTWDLFSNPEKYQLEITKNLIETAKVETTLLSNDESIEIQNRQHFDWTFLNPKYHSSFLNRFSFLEFKSTDEIYSEEINNDVLEKKLSKLYQEDLSLKLDQLKEINEEVVALKNAKNEVVTAEKRIVWHRGNQIKRSDIPTIISLLTEERDAIRIEVSMHDKSCRNIHFEAAKKLKSDNSSYLKKMATIVHYTEHTITNTKDSYGKYNNVLAIAFADGRVSSSELTEILENASEFYYILKRIYSDSKKITLDETLLSKLKFDSYEDAYEEFKLPHPDRDNVNDWVQVVEGWANSALHVLDKLRKVALEKLLDLEDQIKNDYLSNNSTVNNNSNSIVLVDDYKLLMPGQERKLTTKLNAWNRFFVGDGLFPTIAKFAVSGSIVLAALLIGMYSQKSNMYIYNGLFTDVDVKIGDNTYYLSANQSRKIEINYGTTYNIITKLPDGEVIEKTETNFSDASKEYIYNIANAGAFMNYYAFYGYDGNDTQEYLGAKKWFGSTADYKFVEPPKSIRLSSGSKGASKETLIAYSYVDPSTIFKLTTQKEEKEILIQSHVLWDGFKSKYYLSWLSELETSDKSKEVIDKRLKKSPNNIFLLREKMNRADSIQKIKICKEYNNKANADPSNPDLYYLASRCINDEDKKNNAFVLGNKKWKNNAWLAYATAFVFAEKEEWSKSYAAYIIAAKNNASLNTYVNVEAERVRRIANAKQIINSEDITYYEDLESGKIETSNPDYAFYLMSKGKTKEAYDFIKKFEDVTPFVLRQLAVSNGSTKEIMDAYKKLTIQEGMNYYTFWSSLGLTIKEGANYEEFLTIAKDYGIEVSTLTKFIAAVKRGNTKRATNLIKNEYFRVKAHYYVLGNIILGEKSSKKWKKTINAILFVNEHPFID